MKCIKFTFLILLYIGQYSLVAEDRVIVREDADLIELPGHQYWFTDSTKNLNIEQVALLPDSVWRNAVLNGFSQNAEWVRISFINESSRSFNKVLYLNNIFIHQADFYFRVNGQIQPQSINTGLSRSQDSKYYKDPMYPVKVHFPASSAVDVFVRVYDPMSTNNSPFFLMSFNKAMEVKTRRLFFSFLWIGIMVLSSSLSLYLYASIRQKIFLYYVFLGMATGIILTANIGMILLFVDTDPYQLVTHYYQVGAVLLIIFMPKFLNSIVPISELSSIAWKLVRWVGYAAGGLTLLYTIPYFKFSPYYTSFTINTLVNLSTVVFLYLLVSLFIAAVKRMDHAVALFLVYLVYLGVAFGVIVAPFFGAKNDGLNTVYFMIGGSFFETIAFMLLMAQVTLSVYRERERLNIEVENSQKAIMNAIVDGQEKERKRFAADLHDGFGQLITSLNLNLKSLESTHPTKLEKRVDAFHTSSSIIDDMYEELKNICFNLMPQTLMSMGVGEALRELADRLNQTQKITLEVSIFDMDERLAEVQEISLYRISQEWISNVIKYSGATNIELQITKDVNEITLLIEDNGDGFDASELEVGKGNGWKNISSRVSLIKGELTLDTNEGKKGTTFIVNAPILLLRNELAVKF